MARSRDPGRRSLSRVAADQRHLGRSAQASRSKSSNSLRGTSRMARPSGSSRVVISQRGVAPVVARSLLVDREQIAAHAFGAAEGDRVRFGHQQVGRRPGRSRPRLRRWPPPSTTAGSCGRAANSRRRNCRRAACRRPGFRPVDSASGRYDAQLTLRQISSPCVMPDEPARGAPWRRSPRRRPARQIPREHAPSRGADSEAHA